MRWILGAIVAGGVVFSVWDYNLWRHAERDKYGQGPGGASDQKLVTSDQLDRVYQNKEAGIRIRYPNELGATAGKKGEVVRFGEKIVVRVESMKGGLTDRADREVEMLLKKGIKLSREREYTAVETAAITILTWEEGGALMQRAMMAPGDRLIVIDAVDEEGTFRAMLSSLVII